MTSFEHDPESWTHAFVLPDGRRVGTEKDKGKKNLLKISAIQAAVKTGASVLDVGCAEGLFSFYAAESGATDVFGIDLMPAKVQRAQTMAHNLGFSDRVSFAEADVTHGVSQLPCVAAGRDVALLFAVIHRIPDPISLLATLAPLVDTLVIEWPAPYRIGSRRLSYASLPVEGHIDRRNVALPAPAVMNALRRPYLNLSVGAVNGILREFGHDLVQATYAESFIYRTTYWTRVALRHTTAYLNNRYGPLPFGTQQRMVAIFSRTIRSIEMKSPNRAVWDATASK